MSRPKSSQAEPRVPCSLSDSTLFAAPTGPFSVPHTPSLASEATLAHLATLDGRRFRWKTRHTPAQRRGSDPSLDTPRRRTSTANRRGRMLKGFFRSPSAAAAATKAQPKRPLSVFDPAADADCVALCRLLHECRWNEGAPILAQLSGPRFTAHPLASAALAHAYLHGLGGFSEDTGAAAALLLRVDTTALQQQQQQQQQHVHCAPAQLYLGEIMEALSRRRADLAANNSGHGFNSINDNNLNGFPTLEPIAEARALYQAAAAGGFPPAQAALGRCLLEKGDVDQALPLLRSAAEKDYAPALTLLGSCYELGTGGILEDEREAVRLYRVAADQGYPTAMNKLGLCFFNGTGVIKDEAQAVRWYMSAATRGNVRAQRNLGLSYMAGTGVEKDLVQAIKWFQASADQGYAQAQTNLANCLETTDAARAVHYYHLAAQQGHGPAQNKLGLCYLSGKGVEHKDAARAVELFKLAAARRVAGAQRNLGLCYSGGVGVPKDEAEGVRLYTLAAKQGHLPAMNNLGGCFLSGAGLGSRDEERAEAWFKRAAERGHAPARRNLGIFYLSSPQASCCCNNEEEAATEGVKWLRLAAAQGDALAQIRLADCYLSGIGMAAPNEPEGVRWLRTAAQDQRSTEALFRLAECYSDGTGVLKDPVEALRLHRRAADQGHADAQFHVATFYSSGTVVDQDDDEAAKYFRMAAGQGHVDAQLFMGRAYRDGDAGFPRNAVEAVTWLHEAANQGSIEACYDLGGIYRDARDGADKDLARAVAWFQHALALEEEEEASVPLNSRVEGVIGVGFALSQPSLLDSILDAASRRGIHLEALDDLDQSHSSFGMHVACEQGHTAVAMKMLQHGVVPNPMPRNTPAAVLEYGVRQGILDVEHMCNVHERAKQALRLAMVRRGDFAQTFLFGCKKESGSTNLWKIGNRYAHSGLRKTIAELADILVSTDEAAHVQNVLERLESTRPRQFEWVPAN